MTIGIAVIGSGIFAREAHLPAIRETPALKLLAVYSRSLKSAQSLNANVDTYSDDSGAGKSYDDLLARSDIQAVIIALPILSQKEYIKKALSAGKHVLSEKPIAADVKTATELLAWYQKEINGKVTWAIAENQRYCDDFVHAAEEGKGFGAVKHFQVRVHKFTQETGKYYLTPWRTTPGYQGGFLLDGGIHYVAGLRLLLGDGPENQVASVSAHTVQLQKHLPPIDTVNAVLKLKSGASGTFSISFGTMFDEDSYQVAYESGSIVVEDDSVKIRKGRRVDPQIKKFEEIEDVRNEVQAWAKGLETGELDSRQSPEEALRDLKLLEAMFKSGEQGGVPISLE